MGRRKCIYCGKDGGRGEFNREHVIPAAFGVFENTFVLHNCVCVECNDYFGRTIDADTARDSWEGWHRQLVGVKEVSFQRSNRIQHRFIEPECIRGAYAEFVAGLAVPAAQVQFRRTNDGEYEYVLAGDLREDTIHPDVQEVAIMARDAARYASIAGILDRLGVSYTCWTMPAELADQPDCELDTQGRLGKTEAREIAKIAFNYVAHQIGEQSIGLLHNSAFDRVRRFVRYGEGEWRDFVAVREQPILAFDTPKRVQTRGHIVTAVLQTPAQGDCCLLCQVSLFNSIWYDVALTTSYSGLVVPLHTGHCFDTVSRQIVKLTPGV